MLQEEPNYSGYDLEDLKCALSGLDEERFPERGALLRGLISEQLQRLDTERQVKQSNAREFLEKAVDGQHTLLTTNSGSVSKTVLFSGNLLLVVLLIFIFTDEPSWSSGGTLALLLLTLAALFEQASGQLKVSFDKNNLTITQLGFKFLRRNKTIPLADIKVISLQTIKVYSKGFPVHTYILQAQLNNGFAQRLTVVKSEQEGLEVADQINSVISKTGID
jgi:hypothetical protein